MRSAAFVVTVALLVVLVGHLCPVHATPAGTGSADRGTEGHEASHDHHGPDLSGCLPGAVRPAPAVPSLALDVACGVDVPAPGWYVGGRPAQPRQDARHLGPPLHLLDPVLLI